jgi:hypothetical protein
MRAFEMIRNNDESGISGTGRVLEGAIFDNARVVTYWVAGKVRSFGFYDNFYDFYDVHVASHPSNNTEFVFYTDSMQKSVKREKTQLCRHCKHAYIEHPKDKQEEITNMRRTCSGNLVELI